MFKWLTKQSVQSDKGFIVQSAGRFALQYIDGTKKITVNCVNEGEHPNGQFFEVVKSDNFEKWDDGTPIPSNQQEEIKRNFKDGMAFQNIDIIIDDNPSLTEKEIRKQLDL